MDTFALGTFITFALVLLWALFVLWVGVDLFVHWDLHRAVWRARKQFKRDARKNRDLYQDRQSALQDVLRRRI